MGRMMCWSEYEEWLEEMYHDAQERGLESITTSYGVEFRDASDTVVEERDAPKGMSDKTKRC